MQKIPLLWLRFMAQIIFTGKFRVTWGTVCHQDAFATILASWAHISKHQWHEHAARSQEEASQIINLEVSSGVFIIGVLA